MEKNTIGLRIKQLRHREGLTQTDLAKQIRVTKQTLYKYENDIITNIPSDKIEALAKVLHTTPAFLMGWEDDLPPGIEVKLTGDRERALYEQAVRLWAYYQQANPEIQKAVDLLLKVDKQP